MRINWTVSAGAGQTVDGYRLTRRPWVSACGRFKGCVVLVERPDGGDHIEVHAPYLEMALERAVQAIAADRRSRFVPASRPLKRAARAPDRPATHH